jgi:hypothetical protein
MKSRKALILSIVLLGSLFLNGCGTVDGIYNNLTGLVGLGKTATVIAKVAYIRSSYAVVAADLLEVKRGQTLDILEETEFGETQKILWYRVRAQDEDQTEGWIEAQNVITSELLEKSRKLAEEFKGAQPQASGQLRAASNLRLSPDMNKENLLFKLDNGSTFEIIDWNFVPKAVDAAEVDDANKGEKKQPKGKTKNAEIEAAKEDDEPETLTDKYDVWYQVRLDPSVSPAPVGWLFGRQVELQVPSDIVFYQHNNKKFVTWQKLDDSGDKVGDKNDKLSKPSSWVILWRTNAVKAIDGVEPDFDGILVLGFDKYDQLHYTVYRTSNDVSVWGVLPLKVEGTGDSKAFTLKLRNSNTGQIEDKRFVVTSDKTRMRVTAPADIANYEKKDK